jgi:hypothetical protein
VRGKGNKLGEGERKVRLSQDRMPILGEGERDYYQDYYVVSGLLHSGQLRWGLLRTGKLRSAIKKTPSFSTVSLCSLEKDFVGRLPSLLRFKTSTKYKRE